MKTLRNSAEKMPPFFIAPLFLILKDTERLGCLKWNSLKEEGEGGEIQQDFFSTSSHKCTDLGRNMFYKVQRARDQSKRSLTQSKESKRPLTQTG